MAPGDQYLGHQIHYTAEMGRDEKVKLKPKNQNFSLTPYITRLKIVLETGLKSKFRPYMAPRGQYLGYQRPRQQGMSIFSVILVFFGNYFYMRWFSRSSYPKTESEISESKRMVWSYAAFPFGLFIWRIPNDSTLISYKDVY